MGNLRARQSVACHPIHPARPIADSRCVRCRSRLARWECGIAVAIWSARVKTEPLLCPVLPPPSSGLRAATAFGIWDLLHSVASAHRLGLEYCFGDSLDRRTDFTANPLSSSAADCQFSETRCVRRQECRKEGLIDEVPMRAVLQIIRLVRHWPCHSSASKVVWPNAEGQTDSQ